MADDDNFSKTHNHRKTQDLIDSDNSDTEPMKLDLGIDPSLSFEKINSLDGAAASNVNDTPRREDNPFSFKHFLRSDLNNYHHQGARPKVYCDGRPISSVSDLDLQRSPNVKQTRIMSEFSAALPDFVQDHLVVEQCYSNENLSQDTYNENLNDLPSFAPLGHCSLLNGESSRNTGRRTENPSNNLSIPLDLPIRNTVGFPLDLPIIDTQPPGSRSCPVSTEVGVSKSLPDFLTDGAVRTQTNDDNQIKQSPDSEVGRLQQECDTYRQQLIEQNRRIEQLQIQLDASKSKEHEYTKNLVKALEHVEDNLDKSNQRAASAENIITKLRQEIRSLKNEISRLRQENGNLRSRQGATSRPSTSTSNADTHFQRISQELRASANTAENSLRQLLLGVDNLRMIAATIENMNRIEERVDTYSDFEDDSGPAL